MTTHDTTQPLLSAIEDRYFAQIGNAIRAAGLAACPSARYLTFEWNTTEGEPYLDYRDFLDADHAPIPESDDEREARRDTFHSLGMGFESPRDAQEASDDVIEFMDVDRDNSGIVGPQYVFDLTHLRAVPAVSAAVLAAAIPAELLREAAALTPTALDTHVEAIRATIDISPSSVFVNHDHTAALLDDRGRSIISVLAGGDTAEASTEWATGWTA